MKKAVMYGGGNIGRGFIGALLSQSGYEVTFIDVAEPVIKALQEKRRYPIRIVSTKVIRMYGWKMSQPPTAICQRQ